MSAMRMVFITFSALILIGMYLTGFQTAHWFLSVYYTHLRAHETAYTIS